MEGEQRYSSTRSKSRCQMEVGGQCHAPASLSTIKNAGRRVSTAERKNLGRREGTDSKMYASYDFSRFAGSLHMTHHTSSVDMIPALRSWAPSLASEGGRKNPASTNLPHSALPCPGHTLPWLAVRTTPNGPELARVEFYRDAAASIHSVGVLVGIFDVNAKRPAVAARAIREFRHRHSTGPAVWCVSAVGEDVIIAVPTLKLVNGAGVRTSGAAYLSVLLYAYWPIRNDFLVIGTDLWSIQEAITVISLRSVMNACITVYWNSVI